MIPSSKWFPTTLAERAAWFQNFMDNFTPTVATGLGFSIAERSDMDEDNSDFQSIASTQLAADTFMSALRQFRISMTEDPVGTTTPAFPPENFAEPPIGVPAGIFQRLIQNVERIRAAPAYTDETGASLGIIPSSAPGPESDAVPALKPESLPGNLVTVKFVRGHSDGIALEMQIDNESDWTSAGHFGKSPAQITVPANTGNLPRALRLRSRFLEGNSPTGQYSDIVNVTTVP